MNDKKTSVRTLTMLALLVAMSIVFSRVLSISTGFVRFNLGSLPVLLAALLFGFIEALGLRLQKYVPSDLTGMAPYLVTVIMMVAVVLWERKKKNKAVKAEG